MNKFWLLLGIILILGIEACSDSSSYESEGEREEEEGEEYPSEWMYYQRAYPNNFINQDLFLQAMEQVRAMKAVTLRGGEEWELVGPINIGGRITDLALHPTDTNIIYAGAALGGVFKSVDKGVNWTPIFDNAGSLSIGDLALAPSNPNIVYVGTGEANGSAMSGSFFGDGIYKSTDGGQNWSHIGLENSQHIGRIAVDYQNPNRVYVAAAGLLYGKSTDRGLYRTRNGGQSWEQVLYISDSTSCIDVAIHPHNADTVFAVTWERSRTAQQRDYGGLTSRIYRSHDGGDTWQQLTNGLPPDDENRGRIGIAISPSNPKVLLAVYTTNQLTNVFDAIYKSEDGGDSWKKLNTFLLNGMYSSFGWYFGNLRFDPNNDKTAFALAINLFKTTDGGQNWRPILNGMHVDQHALEVHPLNSNFIVAGNDGGVYISENGGDNWRHVQVLPVTQFYQCEVSQQQDSVYFGGTQDNGTLRTLTGLPQGWHDVLGGDGFHVIVDPENPQYVYGEYQYGNIFRSVNGGNSFQRADNGISASDRKNWNTPIAIDPSNPSILYYGSQRVYRSINRAAAWSTISPDLTKGVHADNTTEYATITAIAVSPTDSAVIYVGTDDGNVQRTKNYGQTWELVSQNLPNRYVTEVAVDPRDAAIAYVTFSGFRDVDYLPHVFKTEDYGETWQDISGNLPEIPVNDIIVDPDYENVYYIANDLGVWSTYDGGLHWQLLGQGLPTVIVTDLAFRYSDRTLVAGTYGRSMYKIQLGAPPMTSVTTTPKPFSVFSISPNPASGRIRIRLQLNASLDGELGVYDMAGRFLKSVKTGHFAAGKQDFSVAVDELSDGMYLLRFQTKKGSWVERFLIQH